MSKQNIKDSVLTDNFKDMLTISFFALLLAASIVYAFWERESKEGFEILSNIQPVNNDYYQMRGTVLNNGKAVDSVLVWVNLIGQEGNESSPLPPSVITDEGGNFYFERIPKYLGDTSIVKYESANKETKVTTEEKTSGGAEKSYDTPGEKVIEIIVKTKISTEDRIVKKVIIFNKAGPKRNVQIDYLKLAYLPIIFLISLLFPFMLQSLKKRYLCSIILAFLFSGGIILTIVVGMHYVSTIDISEVISLGYAHIYRSGNEWVFSLTSPANTTTGFWVPIWVLLLSVIGSSLFTVLLILSQITKRYNFKKLQAELMEEEEATMGEEEVKKGEEEVKKGKEEIKNGEEEVKKGEDERKNINTVIEDIVKHQFYMLFAPLGSIFIYQLLVISESTKQPITVAIAAIGAGSALNLILNWALKATEGIIGKARKEKESKENSTN
jgi:hypothetical protein